MAFPVKDHDPQALLDYPLNLKDKGWLEAGDSLASATVQVPDTLVVDHLEVDLEAGVITPWIKVADPTTIPAAGKKLSFTYDFVTAAGRKDQRSRTLNVKER